MGGRIAMIDTERGSGELYNHLGAYDVCSIHPPFEPRKYIECIHAAEDLEYDTIIIDSLTHAWAGQGGLLDIQGHIADKSGNSWSAWRQVTPKHNELVDAMLQSKCHIIATMRSKMEYTQVEENGKKQVKKLGMSPIQRDGMEYEFTVFMDLDHHHTVTATKDRTSLFDGLYFVPSINTGKVLLDWLEQGGSEALAVQAAAGVASMATDDAGTVATAAAGTGTPEAAASASAGKPEGGKAVGKKGGLKHPLDGGNGNGSHPPHGGDGNGSPQLFDRITLLNLPKDAYRLYCYRRYGIESMTELTPDQIGEQAKMLDSLKRPSRLKEFKAILEQIEEGIPEAAQKVAGAAKSANALVFL